MTKIGDRSGGGGNTTLVQSMMAVNPVLFAKNVAQLVSKIEEISEISGQTDHSRDAWMSSYVNRHIKRTGEALLQHIASNPQEWASNQFQIGVGAAQHFMSAATSYSLGNLFSATPSDKRLRDPAWNQDPAHVMLVAAHENIWRWVTDSISGLSSLDDGVRRRALFFIKRISEALSPANIAMTNPGVLRIILETNAENLVHGADRLIKDLRAGTSVLRPRHTDPDAFSVGVNIAATPGKVVFQNELFQLIQYTPTTDEVKRTPILIYPPCINKYYILDLSERKSFVRWLVNQGYTTFVVSWVNPDSALRDVGIEAYITRGFEEALRVVKAICSEEEVNVLGYCIGGTMLATWMSLANGPGVGAIKSATLLTAQTDFTDAGDLQVFVDQQQLSDVEQLASKDGILPGWVMQTTFNMLRANDLVWPYLVSSYLIGSDPVPFDLLYWNSVSTNLTVRSYSEYIRHYYINNDLSKGQLNLCGVSADLGSITTPVYCVAACDDHIAPAASVMRGMRKFGCDVKMVVADSGHVAGMINPPSANKYGWRSAPLDVADNFESWCRAAEHIDGSWWPNWETWLAEHSGELVPARVPGSTDDFSVIEDAPGSYAKDSGNTGQDHRENDQQDLAGKKTREKDQSE